MNPVRKIFDLLDNLDDGNRLFPFSSISVFSHDFNAQLGQCIQLDSITTSDVEKALTTTKPSASTFKEKYIQWQKEFESV